MPEQAVNEIEYERGLTFEKVWAMFQESDRKFEKMREERDRETREREEKEKLEAKKRQDEWDRQTKESDRKLEKMREEWDRQTREREEKEKLEAKKRQDEWDRQTRERREEDDRMAREFDRRVEETDRQCGLLGNRFGEMGEHLVAPNIREKFNELNFNFIMCSKNIEIKIPGDPNAHGELDLLLENGSVSIAIEIKAKPTKADVNKHLKRMALLRRAGAQKFSSCKLQGAIAGAIMTDDIRRYIHQMGFYAIEQTGDTVKIITPENFQPREW